MEQIIYRLCKCQQNMFRKTKLTDISEGRGAGGGGAGGAGGAVVTHR